MDSRFINQFIAASLNVFKKVADIELKKTGLDYFPKGTRIKTSIATILGIAGDFKGQFIIALEEQVTLALASGILMGAKVDTFDELAESAVAEVGNMIGGEASSLLYSSGYECDITVPSMVRGKEIEIALYPNAPIFVVYFQCQHGSVKLMVKMEKLKKLED